MDSPESKPGKENKQSWDIPEQSETHEDPLLDCLLLAAQIFHNPSTREALTAGLPLKNNRLSPDLFNRAAARANISSRLMKRELDSIHQQLLPIILLLEDERACVVTKINNKNEYEILFPETGKGKATLSKDELESRYTGYAFFIKPEFVFEERSKTSSISKARHWFWDTLYLSWPIYAEVVVASLMINLFALATPFFIMNVYDRVVPNQAVETLWVLAIGVAIVFSFDLVIRLLRGFFIDTAGKRTDIILSASIYERIMGMRMDCRPQSVGAFASNLNEFENFRAFFTSASLAALVDFPFIFLFILIIALVAGSLALVPLLAVPLSLAAALLVQKPLGESIQKLFQQSSQKNAALIESLSGMETIKTQGAESAAQTRWEQVIGHIAKTSMRVQFLSATATNVTIFVQQMATVAVVVWGVYKIADGDLTIGALIASTILTGRALAPIAQVASTMTRYHQAMASMTSMDQLMRIPLERPENKPFLHREHFSGSIQFKDVQFSYPNQQISTLNGMSFSIAAGEKVAIIGRVGSGKTTLEKMILGLYEPKEGAVLIDGTDTRQLDPAEIRRNVGYVPQDITLFYGSVKDNITMGIPYADDASVLKAAQVAGVTDFVNRHPNGFDLQVGERGELLSGGQRQSVAIARALLGDPPILLMDEPSNSMDSTTENTFKMRLATAIQNKTLILITHRTSLLTLVDRIILVDNGRIVADGPKEKVLEALTKGQYKAVAS